MFKEKDLLIIVDAQKDFLLPNGKLYMGHDTTELRNRLGKIVNDFPGYIYATKDSHFEGAVEFEKFPEHCCLYTEGWKLIDEISYEKINNFSAKNSYTQNGISSQIIHLLYSELKTHSQTKLCPESTIYVVGVCTHICVHDIICGIVNEAKHHYNIIPKIVILKNLIDDFDPEMSEYALKRLQKLYGVQVL